MKPKDQNESTLRITVREGVVMFNDLTKEWVFFRVLRNGALRRADMPQRLIKQYAKGNV